METRKKGLALVLCMVLCTLALAACGGGSSKSSKYEGTWNATKGESEGVTLDLKELKLFDSFKIIIKAGGDVTVDLNGETSDNKWEETENGIKIVEDEEEMEFTEEDGNLVMDMEGVKITFEKE